MFTGIIEATGTVTGIRREGTNLVLTIRSALAGALKIDQSLSHNGTCLTVTAVNKEEHQAVAIEETLQKTNLGLLKEQDTVNLERAMLLNERIDGHIVQGHVDTTGECAGREEKNGSIEFRFRFPKEFAPLVIEKGSICLNGVSLTIFNVTENEFTVAIIPYTLEHTNLKNLKPGDKVNLEFDLMGKYVNRLQELGRSYEL